MSVFNYSFKLNRLYSAEEKYIQQKKLNMKIFIERNVLNTANKSYSAIAKCLY